MTDELTDAEIRLKEAGLNLEIPTHEDFQILAGIQGEIDRITDEEGWHIAVQTLAGVDLPSLGFVANVQALRAQELLAELDDGTPIPERERNVVLFIDAFTAGYRMAQLHADGVLDKDGSRRVAQPNRAARRQKGRRR